MRAGIDEMFRALGSANPPADLAGQPAHHVLEQRLVAAGAHRRIQINELHEREAAEAIDPVIDVRILDSRALALHQLHDLAAF